MVHFIAVLLLFFSNYISDLEYARTPEERMWGLMGREELPDHKGMLFLYDPPQVVTIWMFNCLIDLDAAFIDADGVIREIHTLKAYPEKMDPSRPVRSIRDFSLYPPNDPIIRFFEKKSVTSGFKVSKVLEMRGGWFADHGVKVGDSYSP